MRCKADIHITTHHKNRVHGLIVLNEFKHIATQEIADAVIADSIQISLHEICRLHPVMHHTHFNNCIQLSKCTV